MTKGLPRSLSRAAPSVVPMVRQTIPVNDAVAVTSVTTGIGAGTIVLDGLPKGTILLQAAVANLIFAGPGASADLSDTWNGDFAIGTVPQSDTDLSDAGEANLIPSTSVGPAVAEVAPIVKVINSTQSVIDNTDGSAEVNLNVLVDAADIGDSKTVNLTVTGFVELLYSVLSYTN